MKCAWLLATRLRTACDGKIAASALPLSIAFAVSLFE